MKIKTRTTNVHECVVCGSNIYGEMRYNGIFCRTTGAVTGRVVEYQGKKGFAHSPKCSMKCVVPIADWKKAAANDDEGDDD